MESNEDCIVCFEKTEIGEKTPCCFKNLCSKCLKNIREEGDGKCPNCRESLNPISFSDFFSKLKISSSRNLDPEEKFKAKYTEFLLEFKRFKIFSEIFDTNKTKYTKKDFYDRLKKLYDLGTELQELNNNYLNEENLNHFNRLMTIANRYEEFAPASESSTKIKLKSRKKKSKKKSKSRKKLKRSKKYSRKKSSKQ